MLFRPLLAAVVAAALALTAAAEDAVAIKTPAFKAGDKFKVIKTEKNKSVEKQEAGGKNTSNTKEDTREVVYTEEVLAPGTGGERPTKSVRVYEKFEVVGDPDVPAPPLNAPITISTTGDKYTFACEKPLGAFAKKLDDEFNRPNEPTTKDFLPGKPVKPGDSWTIDPAKFVKSLAEEKLNIDAEKAAVSGKLLKVYEKDGKTFGVIEMALVLPLKDLGKDGPPLKRGAFTAKATADVCIDGTDPTENTKALLGFDVLVETKEFTLSLKTDGVLTTKREPLPRK